MEGEEYLLEQLTEDAKILNEVKQVMQNVTKTRNKWTLTNHTEMQKKYEVGPFRTWQLDMERLKGIFQEVEKRKETVYGKRGPYNRHNTGTGKKQRAEELKKLISEIENG